MGKNIVSKTDAAISAATASPSGAPIASQTVTPPADTAVNSQANDTAAPAGSKALMMEVAIDRFHVRATRQDGFRRAGRHWPAEGVEVDTDALDEQQITALLSEPMLVVTPIASRVPTPGPAPDAE